MDGCIRCNLNLFCSLTIFTASVLATTYTLLPVRVCAQALMSRELSQSRNYQSLQDTDVTSLPPEGYGGATTAAARNKPPLISVRSPIMSIFVFCMKQSYVATLIMMMVSE